MKRFYLTPVPGRPTQAPPSEPNRAQRRALLRSYGTREQRKEWFGAHHYHVPGPDGKQRR